MTIEQLQLFQQKGNFNSAEFESDSNQIIFKKIGSCISSAISIFASYDIKDFDNTTRSNMLNNLVISNIERHCKNEKFKFFQTLTGTRRSLAILDDKFILFFKKSPVSNVKTNQDDLIKNQELDKHVIFVVYTVDEFWSSISKLEFLYYVSPESWTYSYDITSYLTEELSLSHEDNTSVLPDVKVKDQEIIRIDRESNSSKSDGQLKTPSVKVKKQANTNSKSKKA